MGKNTQVEISIDKWGDGTYHLFAHNLTKKQADAVRKLLTTTKKVMS